MTPDANDTTGVGIPIATSDSVQRPLKVAEVVARAVVRDIAERGLTTGDSLESEAAMMERYELSRESLREGLRILEVKGVIAIRRGNVGGAVVGTVDPASLGRVQALFLNLAGATYEELFDAWVLAETILAERAAKAADRETRLRHMAPFVTPNEDDVTAEDFFIDGYSRFHDVVAKLAGNRVLQVSLRTYGQIVAHHVNAVSNTNRVSSKLAHDHLTIARLIVAGHSKAAGSAMRDHLEALVAFARREFGDDLGSRVEWI